MLAGFLLIGAPSTFGQTDDLQLKIRLAQSFEQAGEWERAAAIYEPLQAADPQNYVLFDALRRCYVQLKEYDQAMKLVRQRLSTSPNDPVLLSSLGALYFQKGEQSSADSIWNLAVQTQPGNTNLYRLVASQMMELRLYEQALGMYLKARSESRQPLLFADERAMLYGALMQYGNATREYLAVLLATPQQLSYVQSRLTGLIQRPEGLEEVLKSARAVVLQNPEYVPLKTLLAWLYLEKKEYPAAYEEYREIDRLTRANGQEIFNFAQRAVQERLYPIAERAFREFIDRYPSHRLVPFARFGLLRSLEEIRGEPGRSEESRAPRPTLGAAESRFEAATLISQYEGLIVDYPNSEVAAQALFRIGVIRHDVLFELDAALDAFQRVRIHPHAASLAADATLRVAEILLQKNMLAESRRNCETLRSAPQESLRDLVTYQISLLEYYEGQFDSALVALEGLSANPNRDLANDALQLMYFINENRSSAAALKDYATADLLLRQHRFSEALQRFDFIVKQYPTALLLDDAHIRIGEILTTLGKIDDAIAVYVTVVENLPDSIVRDKALMALGGIYERYKDDPQRAIATYEQVLMKFPTSVHVEEARQRIRMLRGDSL